MNWKTYREKNSFSLGVLREAVWIGAIILLAGYAEADNMLLYAGLLIIRGSFVLIFGHLIRSYIDDKFKPPLILLAMKEMAWISVLLFGVGLFGNVDAILYSGITSIAVTCSLGFISLCISCHQCRKA